MGMGGREMTDKQLIDAYNAMCPDDPVSRTDNRYADILAEMRAVYEAATIKEAAKVILWWDVWGRKATAAKWVRRARVLMGKPFDAADACPTCG